jgi:alkanesulfonate monooxygenase SsuD/methylene tetrahydromethanopterin reductase-like flavin-dependent oxidoreductase (luciferase family)
MALAVSVMPLENRREMVLHLAAGAERLGYDAVYLPETWSWDVTVLLGEIAARTERIGLGTGILGVWGRSAAQIAMAAATLHIVSGGRFALGLGASTKQLTEGFHDVPFVAPVARMRQIVTQVRALLRGERAILAATPGARPLRLNLPPAPALPVYLAGLAPDSVRLAGELADGWLPFLYPRSRLAYGMARLREGAARSDPPRALPLVHPSLPTVVAADEAEARRGAASFLTFYLTSMGPFYPGVISRLGFEREVSAVIAANSTRGTAVVPAEAEVLLDELIVYGTPEQARNRLTRWQEAGAAMPILLLPANLERAQMDFALHAFR